MGYNKFDTSPDDDNKRMVSAAIEHARRVTQFHRPHGDFTDGGWKPTKTFNCCAQHSGSNRLIEHCKGAEHVAAEFGLHPNAAGTVSELAGILHQSRLSYRLPEGMDEHGLNGILMKALNDSWRRLYGNAKPQPGTHEEARMHKGLRPSEDVFAERIGRRMVNVPSSLNMALSASPMRRMTPGAA